MYTTCVLLGICFLFVYLWVTGSYNFMIKHMKCKHGNYIIADTEPTGKVNLDDEGIYRYDCCCPYNGYPTAEGQPHMTYSPTWITVVLVCGVFIPVIGGVLIGVATFAYLVFGVAQILQNPENRGILFRLIKALPLKSFGSIPALIVAVCIDGFKLLSRNRHPKSIDRNSI